MKRERSRSRHQLEHWQDTSFPAAEPTDRQINESLRALARLLARRAARERFNAEATNTGGATDLGDKT